MTASSVNMIAGAVIDVDSMDMDVNDEQAAQSLAVSVSQQPTENQDSVMRKSGRKRRSDRGSKGQKSGMYLSVSGDQRGEVKKSKIQH